ncbi:hypothetical protein EI546_04590 [Aequorivita sp. H23M31]|uniref:Signal transduction histidine kinase internal region domain-containing protein n=1 Tax=Aequorivita ciconiae TaxID=2494375 RepID=A0A410G199_9FLAO|nr:sensor histidine kinase [Aequorivita sp. H23M31]QAA81046.1 hypothetical protein EI546_04590 [Aequorivita sp. H23M31]
MDLSIKKCQVLFLWMGHFLMFSQQYLPSEGSSPTLGIPLSNIINSVSAPSGYLYVADRKGIFKYDGYRAIKLQPQKQVWSSLLVDGDYILFQDIEGLKKINTVNDNIELILKNEFTDENPNNDHFDNIFVDSKGRIWSTDFNYVKYYSPKDNKLATLLINSESKNLSKFSIFEPIQNEIWIASEYGLCIWKEEINKLQRHSNEALSKLKFSSAYFSKSSNILLATEDGKIIEISPNDSKIQYRKALPDNEVPIGFLSYNNNVFIYTHKKIFLIGKESYVEIFDSGKSNIFNVHIDITTNIFWISTDKGLLELSPRNPGIEILELPLPDSEEKNIISVVEELPDKLWILTDDGEVWSLEGDIWKLRFRKNGLKCYVLNLVNDKIVLSTQDGIHIFSDNGFQEIPFKNISPGEVIKILEVAPQEIWVVFAHQKIQRYSWPDMDLLPDRFTNPETFWKNNQWNDILMDREGMIWLAGWMPKGFGINRYDPVKHYFTDISHYGFNNSKSDFVGDYYNRISLTDSSNLLFSAYGGFNEVDENGRVLKKVDINQYPISDSHLEGISSDKKGNVFFATASGLNVYRRDLDKVVQFQNVDGIPEETLLNAFTTLKDGKFAIGISNGIVIIDPDKILATQLQNRFAISEIKIDGILQSEIKSDIELSKDQTDLTVYFSNLSFLDPSKVRYQYRFIDSNNWIDLGHNPELSINHISPGIYHIQVRSEDNLFNIQKKILSLSILANPPFFKSNLFYFLLLLLIIIVVVLIQKYLTARKHKDAAYQQKIKETEMQMLRSQMNPHFMFNTLNSINSYIIQNKTEDASAYLTTFSKLMRSILQNSKEQWITLDNELETLRLYIDLESARLEHSFSYEIKVEEEVDPNSIQVPPLIIQPFVENAIWHGLRNKRGKGNLKISVWKPSENELQISIEDNGVGRERSTQLKTNQVSHKSFGMEITLDRLKMLDSDNNIVIEDLYDSDKNPLGTKIILTIKISDHD